MAKLQQNSREKIGIVVFIAAIIFILIVAAAYINIGHSFDLTASGIDENVGQLNDYVAVVFEGDNVPRTNKNQSTDKTLHSDTDVLDKSAQDEQTTSTDPSAENASKHTHITNTDNDESSTNAENAESAVNNTNTTQSSDGTHTEKANTKNVSRIYEDKGATTASIRVNDYKAYENGEIIERDIWRIGVLSITQQTLTTLKNAKETAKKRNDNTTPVVIEEFQKKINNLRDQNKASFVILLSPDQSVMECVSKVDCVIAQNVKDEVGDEGKAVGDVFVMRIPDTGYIGAIVSSPAKMMSGSIYSKVVVKDE